jgi:hypothetical protein
MIKELVTNGLGKAVLTGKRLSPEILTVAGIVGVVAAGVLAARSTLKVEAVVEEHKRHVEDVRELSEAAGVDPGRELTKVYVHTSGQFVKLYGPSVTLGAASIAAILGGHNILRKRNAALVVAYKGLESAFNRYRGTIRDEFGEEKERELYYRGATREIEITHEDGTVERTTTVDPTGLSPYARLFSEETTKEWDAEVDYNIAKLTAEQNWLNERLLARGHVFLNEVYDRLGLERSAEGQVVGWTKDGKGDGYIDFGLFKSNTDGKSVTDVYEVVALSNAHNAYLLDFNVDGPIINKI